MNTNKFLTAFLCLLFSGGQIAHAAAPEIDFEFSPVPNDIKTLDYRLDNLDSSVAKLKYALNHLDKNIVLLQVTPLSDPHASFDDILKYATMGVTEALNFDYTDFRHILSEASEFYTPKAYKQLQQFLADIALTNKTKARKITNSALIMAPPILMDTKIRKVEHPNIPNQKRDVYTWEIEMPLYIQSYTNGKLLQTLKKNVKLRVARCSVEYSADQMLIDDIIFEDYKLGV